MYLSKWNEQFKSDESLQSWKESWAEEFAEEKITFSEIKRGLDYCKHNLEWPPSFPQFFKACRPSLDYEAAFIEANQQMHLRNDGNDEWSNPAIFHAAASMGADMSTPYANVKSRWKAALDKAIQDVQSGRLDSIVPKRPQLLGAPKRQGKEYSEVAKRELEKISEILNTEPAWKKKLREKGASTQSPEVGLKHVSEHIALKERVA